MELADILAVEGPHIQAKEAEALAILTAYAGPALQMLDGAQRKYGQILEPRELGVFVSSAAEQSYREGKREATKFLFDVYAAVVFAHVTDAETFIALLGSVGARVTEKLSLIDYHEAELCRLEWVKRAWERAKPTSIQRALMRLRVLFKRTSVTPWVTRDPSNLDNSSQATTSESQGATKSNNAVVGVTASGAATARYPVGLKNRVSWLQDRLLERGWSTSDPSKWGGPDRKTIEKIIRGEPVGNAVLLKMAEALSKAHAKVSVSDIPRD